MITRAHLPPKVSDNRTVTTLEPGTLIEADVFAGIVVSHDKLLIFDTEVPEYVNVNNVLTLEPRGSNDWSILVSQRVGWSDYWITCDWNGRITTVYTKDPWDDNWEWWEEDDWDDSLRWVDAYDDYRSLSSPAHVLRVERARSKRRR